VRLVVNQRRVGNPDLPSPGPIINRPQVVNLPT